MSSVGKFLGTTVGEGAAFAAGLAVGPALRPILQALENVTWSEYPDRPINAETLAHGVAQGHITMAEGVAEAALTGTSESRFGSMVTIAKAGPGVAAAFELWRRGVIGEDAFKLALERAAIEQEWIDALVQIKSHLLDPAQLAVMIQRTVVANPGILPNQPSTAGSNVPPMPLVDIDPIAEAAGSGVDAQRLAAMARIIGLPASPDLAARMHFRNIITEGAFNQAILEGNTRGEWAPFLLEGFRAILTPHEYAELDLRGFLSHAERDAGAAKHGMSAADTQLVYDVIGRAVAVHAVTTGLARGGVYPSKYADVPEPYRTAIQRSNIREEWAGLAYANRYSYPSAFVLRSLTQAGDISGDEAHQILLNVGWEPTLAATVSAKWAGGTGAVADKHVVKAETQLWTTLHTSYKAEEVGADAARATLGQLGVAADAQTAILALWDAERALIRKQLTAAQVKKAFRELLDNPATGAPFTRDDALGELVQRGYSVADAGTFLDE